MSRAGPASSVRARVDAQRNGSKREHDSSARSPSSGPGRGLRLAVRGAPRGRGGGPQSSRPSGPLPGGYKNLVVIYEENHSFDNLYGDWGRVGGQVVNGLQNATAAHTTQVAQDGSPYQCLLQNDVNLTSPPLPADCADRVHAISSHFRNWWFTIDDYIKPTDTTCPAPGVFARPSASSRAQGLPGGCTRDLVHRFYQEQYQIDGGRQDRYVTGSDAVGLTMGRYETKTLPIYQYLHSKGAPELRRRRQLLPGGLRWLVPQPPVPHRGTCAASSPAVPATVANSILDAAGFPNNKYPLYHPTTAVTDGALTAKCANSATFDYVNACGNIAVNTIQPASPPRSSGATMPLIDDSVYPNIGDRMSAAGHHLELVLGRLGRRRGRSPRTAVPVPPPAVQLLRQLRARSAPGRSHLQDETKFIAVGARTARCRRSRSSSRTARRTSTPATPVSRTAVTTSSTCSRRS